MKARFLLNGARFVCMTVMLLFILLTFATADAQADQWENTLPGTAGGGLAVSRQNPLTAYHSGYNGIWKTTDGGATWTLASNGIPTPYDNQAIWVAADDDNILYVSHYNYGWYKSIDGGNSWFQILQGGVPGWSVLSPSDHNVLYLNTYADSLVTRDGGATWSQHCLGRVTAIDPLDPNIAYGSTPPKKTVDGGQTCFSISSLNLNVFSEFGPGRRLYGFTFSPTSFYYSDDGGANWIQTAGNGFPTGSDVWGFAIDPNDRNHLLISESGYGIHESRDGGENWSPINVGYPIGSERSVIIGFDNPPTFYASTNGNGVWVYHPSVQGTLFEWPHGNYTKVINRHTNCDYGSNKCGIGKNRGDYHTGIDSEGDLAIYPAGPGRIVKMQPNVLDCKKGKVKCPDHGLGNTMIIEHTLLDNSKIYTLYAHLKKFKGGLSEGMCVTKATRIGTMGRSGSGKQDAYEDVHLHFEFKTGNYLGDPRTPDGYFGYIDKKVADPHPDNWGFDDPEDYVGIVQAVEVCN